VVADRDEVSAEEVADLIRRAGGSGWSLTVDVADVEASRAMVERAIDLAGGLDILVNNAGVTRRIGLFEMSEADWEWIHGVNTKGLFFCLQAVAAHMRDHRRGKIVNISSIGGKGVRGTSNAAYAGSKAAAIAVTRVAAAELGMYNINVNAVCPGSTRTEMLGGLEHDSPEVMAAVTGAAVLGRINQPIDVANVVVFLVSPLADNITGQSLNVDNGVVWD
jgi:NAD(P)-dependent dehydrogenase (short-subunit alcohol dehydrogenase family)